MVAPIMIGFKSARWSFEWPQVRTRGRGGIIPREHIRRGVRMQQQRKGLMDRLHAHSQRGYWRGAMGHNLL